MQSYYRQIGILAAIALVLIAVVFLSVAFTRAGDERVFANNSKTTVSAAAAAPLVNINTADAADLALLPGIGQTRAQNIIAYREAHGAFQTPEQLMEVKGIGEKTFEGLKDYVCTE